MSKMMRLFRDQRGASFVEYLILVGVIAIVGIVAFEKFGGAITGRAENFRGKVETLGN
jgi:Flp pilus assembly pilin Flp